VTTQELQALGLTTDDVLNRLTEKLSDLFVGSSEDYASDFQSRIERAIKQQVDAVLDKAITELVAPNVVQMIETIQLQETNRWGEPKSTPALTFKEYLTQRVDAYIREQVDYKGKAKDEDGNSYGWSGRTTRIAYMINQHIHYTIEAAMKDALKTANNSIGKSLEDAVNLALKQVTVNVKTEVKS
jgi:hypothetical protein